MSNKTLETGNQHSSKSIPKPSGQAQKKKPIRQIPGPEKKIGEDEFMAAAIGDVEWLRQSIRGNRGMINYDKNGLSPLHLAAIHGRLDCLKLLLEKFKMDINLPSKTGWRPIHLVISNQTGKRAFQCLSYLLEKECDPSIANEDGITPMHQAASEGHVQCLKALIDIGAKVNGVDYRGHTPLDLAKLWGHRKCARILAAEEWHQNKEYLEKEMKRLEKLEMQQVLREIEADEENKAHQEFYGDLAFKEWLKNKRMETQLQGHGKSGQTSEKAGKSTSITTQHHKEKHAAQIRKAPQLDTVHKANSVQQPKVTTAANTHTSAQTNAVEGKKKVPQLQQPSPPPQKLASQSRQPDSLPARQPVPTENKAVNKTTSKEDTLAEPYIRSDWNKSTKVIDKDYIPNLKDHYPHDEYTMLPRHPAKRYSRTPNTLTEDGDGQMDISHRAKTPEKREREVVYKCKHIFDIHKKKHYDEDRLPKSELGMHLANDPGSKIFQKGLLDSVRMTMGDGVRPMTGMQSPHDMDLESIMKIMERMSKPTQFPPIKGAHYDLYKEEKAC